jgi:HK97 family phage major capsid protein
MWAPGFGGQPATLAGYPIVEFEDMADIAGGNIVAGFGNFRQGYTIVDRLGIRILRDPYSAKPHVEFYTTKRVGGDVLNFEAFKLMDIAAS